MNPYCLLLLNLLLVLTAFEIRAQGCSDAGFCSVGNLKHAMADSAFTSGIQLSFPWGAGDEGTQIITPAIQYERQVSHRWAMQAKITGNYSHGNLGAVSGPGDVYLAGIHTRKTSRRWTASLMIAAKLPLSRSNLKEHGRHLPMAYQSSLGSIDVISGISMTNSSWNFSLGLQHPVTPENKNNFLPQYWEDPEATSYPPTNRFNRKGDLLLRVTYAAQLSSTIFLQGGILNLYHLSEDSYWEDDGISMQRVTIVGSKGLTVNITGSMWLTITKEVKVGLTAATPLVVRDARPDGLTRSFVISPELRWTINQ